MYIKMIALICPIVLFVFKYILPSYAEELFANRGRARGQISAELIRFPVDLLFVVAGYTIPKIIEAYTQLTHIMKQSEGLIVQYQPLLFEFAWCCAESIIVLMLIPFFVFYTKSAEKNFYKKKKRWIIQTITGYSISCFLIWFSMFRV